MVIDDLSWLLLFCKNQKISNCKIVTIDNPGFSITIDLQNTSFLNKSFDRFRIDRSEHDWIYCFIYENRFNGACGPTNLSELFSIFRKWIEGNLVYENSEINWLTQWYVSHCNGDWEHEHGLQFRFSDLDLICHIIIDLTGTECEEQEYDYQPPSKLDNSIMECFVCERKFYIECDPINISLCLQIFREWADQFHNLSNDFLGDGFFKKCERMISRNKFSNFENKIKVLYSILKLKKVLSVIPFRNMIHIVFYDNISLNIYSKISTSKDVRDLKGSTLRNYKILYPFINFQFSQDHMFSIDLDSTYEGHPVRLELSVPKQYAIDGFEWIQGNFPEQPWVLYV